MAERDSTPEGKAGPSRVDLLEKPHWSDRLSRYLVFAGFTSILLSGVCFWLFRNYPLQYDDFVINTDQLGKYLLMMGAGLYFLGRILFYRRRLTGKGNRPG